jgi:hypothetical protein
MIEDPVEAVGMSDHIDWVVFDRFVKAPLPHRETVMERHIFSE